MIRFVYPVLCFFESHYSNRCRLRMKRLCLKVGASCRPSRMNGDDFLDSWSHEYFSSWSSDEPLASLIFTWSWAALASHQDIHSGLWEGHSSQKRPPDRHSCKRVEREKSHITLWVQSEFEPKKNQKQTEKRIAWWTHQNDEKAKRFSNKENGCARLSWVQLLTMIRGVGGGWR